MTDFESKTERLVQRTAALREELAQVQRDLVAATGKTAELLDIAAEAGVSAVSIGKIHERVGNERWTYGNGAIFTPVDERVGGWPAAWHIAERAGISQGAGNPGQHQADTSGLIDGVYECRGGLWTRIDLEAVSA